MPDRLFPRLHVRPASGWLNDPNGLCRIDGTYHVFYQYNPVAPTHGDICWGHASSSDLVSWQEHPIALRPRPGGIDAGGCWSGCIVDDAGTPTAVYTAVPDHSWNGVTALATSDRTLLTWTQSDDPVAVAPEGADFEMRDPFVFTHQGRRYAVQGAGRQTGRPSLLLFGCDSLTDWHYLGPLLTDDDPVAAEVAPANIWECPNLVLVDGRWTLLLSIWRLVDGHFQLSGVRYLLGELTGEGETLRFRPTGGGALDGPAFYAPQVLVEPDRVLLWTWSWEIGRTPEQVAAAGWAGVLSFPRELYLDGDRLGQRPAAELVGLRTAELDIAPGQPIDEASYELLATAPLTLRLADADVVSVPAGGRILVDGSLVEAFDDGRAVTTRAYPEGDASWTVVTESPVTAYRLG